MTLSLNPTLTQNKEKNTEIQVANTDLVTQHKPMPQLQAQNTDLNTQDNTESNTQAQEPIHQTQNTTQSFDINNKAYQDFVKAKLAAQKGAEVLNDKFSNNDYIQGAYRAVKESAKSFNPLDEETKERYNKGNSGDALWEAWNTITGQTALRNYNKEKLKEKEAQQAVYSYLEKYGTSKESIGLKNYEEDKLKEQKLIKGIQNKETKDLSEEEKDYLRDSESNISRFIDYLFTDENKNLQKYKNNLTRQNINHELVKKLVILDSQNSSIFNLTEDLQKEARQKTLTSGTKLAQMYGYDRLEYDAQAQDYVLIDKEGNKLYPDMQSVFNNLGTALEANYYDVVSSFIPVGKAAQVTKGGIKLTQSLTKTALQSAGMSAIASPLDYINMQNETAQEGDIQDILKHSAGNALGSAVGVYVGAGIAKGASKAYNSIKDLKNLSTDDLKNIKISKYLDNEEASIHRKLAKFNKSEIDSNYEIFKNLQSDRVISKEMKDPTFMGNFMDKISDYNVLKHLSSKKESQDKLLSALFSNKELAREFAGKLTSEEATIVNKAIHAMGENFTRLSKEYEQQIIDEYAKSGKIKGLNPHTEMQSRHVEPQAQTSHLNGNKDVFTLSQHDKGLNQYDINFNAPTKQVKSQMIEALKPIFNQTMTSSDGVQAYMSLKSLSKMTSPQAIQKSIDNGFSREEHLKAVLDIQRLFENAKLQATEPHKSGEKNAIIHRLNSELENGNALITTKESLDANKNRVYSLELELTPRFSDSSTPLNTKISEGGFNSQKGHQEQTIKAEPSIAKTDTDIIPQNLPEVYKHMLDEIDKQAKADYKTSIDNLQNALSDIDFKATLLQGYKQVTDDAIESLGLDNQLTNTLIRETQKLESKQSISLSEAIELRKNINEIMRNYEKSSSDLKKFRANKHLDNIKDNIDNAIKNALDSKVAQNEAQLGRNEIEISPLTRQEADELFSNFQQANKNYAQIKESLNDKFAKALTKGMNKKDLDSRLTIEQWKQRVLDTQWGDSVKGLENTIFKNFNPRMQKHTQMLTILRALDRNVKLNDDTFPIDFTKILSDIENLEKLTLHPEIYPILDTFKSYAKSYQFAQEISKAKALENQVGSGALATTLEGRIKVFLTNRLFKKLFAFIPYIGDNAAITKALQSAIKDLKYPSEITLETLKVLNKADLDKGFKPIKDKENKPRFEYKANTPLNDAELQSQIRGNTQILTPKDTSEIEALASNPLIQNMERQAKYNEELTQKISQFEANKENIQQDILNNLVVATQEIKQNTELLKQLAQQLTQNNPIHTPNKSIIKAEANNETYFITTDKNNITAIEKQELQLAQPKTYDELMQRDKNQNATLESYRDQYADIAEIKEAQAEKQLLLEYKPEIKETSTSIDNTQINKDTDLLKNLYGNNKETNLYANMQSNPNIKAQEKALKETDSNFTYTTQETKGIRDLRNDLKEALMPYKTQPITNKETGMQGYITADEINKISSRKAVDKSIANGFSRDEHFAVAQDLKTLFENSKLRESHNDYKNNPNILQVHRFTKEISVNHKNANAQITLFEKIEGKNRIYTLELESLNKPDSLSVSVHNTESAAKAQSVATAHPETTPIAKTDTDIIPQKLTERIKNDLDSNDYAEMLKSLKQLENKQAEIDTFTNETNLIRNTLEKQETEKYEKIVSPLFDKYPIMKEFYNERDINTHIYFKRFKNEFLERYNTQYDFFTLDEKAFLAKYPNFTQQDYKEATTQNLKALKDKNVSINEYVSFAKEYMDIVNNPVFEKMAKEIDSVDKKYWDTHFEMSEQRDSKVNEIIAILKKDIDSIDIANKADVSIDNFHKLGRYLAFMKQPEFGFANKLTFTKTGFFGKFLEQTDIKQRELLGELLSVEKLLEKEGKANRVLQDRLFTIFRLMRGEELLDREIKDVPLARELIEKQLNIKPIKEFGTNYAEHYHSGETAIQKLINEAQAHKESGAKGEYKGQVAGAFHRDDIGDITLAWGEKGTGKSDGWGLSKIVEYHPEVLDKLDKLIQDLPIVKETENRYKLDNGDFFISIRRDFEGQKQNWVLTALERDESIARRRTDLPSSQSEAEKTTSANATNIIPQTPQEIIKQAKASGKSVAETKKLLQKHNKEIQSIRTEIRKDIATRQKNIEQGYIDIVSSHHAKIGKKGGYTTKMYLETDKEKQSYLYDGFNKESLDNYLQLVKENAPLKERNKALDKLVNERLEAEARFSQLQKQQEELEEKQLQAFDEESFIKSLEGKSKDELENIQGDLWNKSEDKNNDIPFPVIARMSNLVMWIKDKIPQAAFNNDELREAIKSLRLQKEYKDDINSIQYFKENRAYIEQTLNIKPIREFGTNYAEHYHSGETAIQKLISEAQAHKESGAKGEYKGQVAGAFHRKELGDIDLVWGEVKGKGKNAKGYGLAKIIEKHLNAGDFEAFGKGEAGLINAMSEIIQNGKLLTENGVNTLYLQKDNKVFLVGLSKGWDKKGENQWIITSYEANNLSPDILEKIGANKTFPADESLNALQTFNATDNNIIPQTSQEIVKNNNIKESANMLESKVKMQGQDLNLIYNTQEAKHIATLRTDLKEALSPYLNKEIVNKATGITAQISTTGLNKIASKKAIDKSVANGFSRDEHFKVAQDLKTLFENATKKESYADKKQSNDVMAMHRFFAEIIINNKQAQAKMTLKESIEHGNRIYSLELEELIPSINAQPHTKEAQARGS